MFGGHVMDQFLNQHGFAHAGAAEEADLAPLGVGGQEVDDLDAGFQHLHGGALLGEGGGLPVNVPVVLRLNGALFVDGLAQHIEHAAQVVFSHRDGDAAAGMGDGHILMESVAGGQHDAADQSLPQVLGDLHHASLFSHLDGESVSNAGQLSRGKGHVDDSPHDGDNFCLAHIKRSLLSWPSSGGRPWRRWIPR